jgi:uncharacterized glyoxalase superfamily protein PhnB
LIYFEKEKSIGFYLQDYEVKEWIENTMVFIQVEDLSKCYQELINKELPKKYRTAKITKIKDEEWGNVFHVIDPSGILWHFAEFSEKETEKY